MKVPFVDFSSPYKELQKDLDAAYQRFMESGWYVLGKEVEEFEREYAKYCGTKYCVGVGNCLDGLELALSSPLKKPQFQSPPVPQSPEGDDGHHY